MSIILRSGQRKRNLARILQYYCNWIVNLMKTINFIVPYAQLQENIIHRIYDNK